MTTITNSDRALKDITVGKRIRHDLGDIDALAKSITERGLLHPIVISPMGDLLAGHRRLEAVRSLGWEAVPVRVVTDVADMRDALNIERDENTQRKPFTPSEADALARTIEALEKPKARERKARPGSERSAKLAEQAPRPRDVAAEATGLGHETLRKARAVVDAATDPDLPEEARAVAQQAQAQMDATGKVDPAFRKTMAAVTEADPENQAKSVAVSVNKMLKAVTGIVSDVTPEAAARLVPPDWKASRASDATAGIEWLTAYRASLTHGDLKVAK